MHKVVFSIFIMVIISKSIFGISSSFESTPKISVEFLKVEIIDSSICIVLDSIIAYEKECLKKKSRLITYYDIWTHNNYISKGGIELTVFSKLDGYDSSIDTTGEVGLLYYKDRYFLFRNFSKTNGLERYLKLSTSSEAVVFKKKKITNLGKTYSTIGISISEDSFYITGCYCMCYYGKLGKLSKNVGLRKFFYDLFCPCRGVRRL